MQMVLQVIYPSKQFPHLSLLTGLIINLIILKAFLSHLQTVYFSPCDLKQRVYACRIGSSSWNTEYQYWSYNLSFRSEKNISNL